MKVAEEESMEFNPEAQKQNISNGQIGILESFEKKYLKLKYFVRKIRFT